MASAARAESTAEAISASYMTILASQGCVRRLSRPSSRRATLIQATPVDTNADGFVPADRGLHHHGELFVLLSPYPRSRVDSVLGQSLGTVQESPLVIGVRCSEVANQGNVHAMRSLLFLMGTACTSGY